MENENLLKGLEQLSAAAISVGRDPAFVLLRDKRAFQKGWPNLRPSLEDILAHVQKSTSHSVGIQPASLGLVVLDCDEGAGPHVAADAVREKFGDVVACVTQSSTGRADRGHVWLV